MKKFIEIEIPLGGESSDYEPYLLDSDFEKYCNANNVKINRGGFEILERDDLLLPCYKVIYPEEYIIRSDRAERKGEEYFTIRPGWEVLNKYREYMSKTLVPLPKYINEVLLLSHPLEAMSKQGGKYIFKPSSASYKPWDKFEVYRPKKTNGHYIGRRLENYYSTWKIFILDEIATLNTIEENLATKWKYGWRLLQSSNVNSELCRLEYFFRKVSTYFYRVSIISRYFGLFYRGENNNAYDAIRCCARILFLDENINAWVNFLRELLTVYEQYTKQEKYLLREELKRFLLRVILFIMRGSDVDFKKICRLYDEGYKGRSYVISLNGKKVFPHLLETIFPSESLDIQEFFKVQFYPLVQRALNIDRETRTMREIKEIFENKLILNPENTIVGPLIKLHKIRNNEMLWSNYELWGAIKDLVSAIEYHGKEWFGGNFLGEIFKNYDSNYHTLIKNNKGFFNVSSEDELFAKLAQAKKLVSDAMCSVEFESLIVTHLFRNYVSHNKPIMWKALKGYYAVIINSLLRTFFLMLVKHNKI